MERPHRLIGRKWKIQPLASWIFTEVPEVRSNVQTRPDYFKSLILVSSRVWQLNKKKNWVCLTWPVPNYPMHRSLWQKLATYSSKISAKQDLSKARQEKSAIEEITKTLNEVHFASTIKLNVGGKIYETTLDTLRKDPDSMLCAMFSGRFELKANERDGAYFIDRDGKLFRWVVVFIIHKVLNALAFIISPFFFLMELLPQGSRSGPQSVVAKVK